MTGTQRRRVVLDTDPGIDDALAILLALASPEIDLAALTVVHGNCPLEDAVANALAVLHLGGAAQVPVAVGCDRPLLREAVTAQDTHGGRGLGFASLPPGPPAPVAGPPGGPLIPESIGAAGG
ncbi:MAG TPA: nucleoside hydrolase, partial [Chloroflexaceae bacterium]|nr:nucleoside hydrolase [Chloroflexaceae bacterium]